MAYRHRGRDACYLHCVGTCVKSINQSTPALLACRFRTAYLTEAAARQADTAIAEVDEELEWSNEIEADDVELDSDSEDAVHDADNAQRRAG